MTVIWMFDPPCRSLWDWQELVLWGLLVSDDWALPNLERS